MVAKTRTEDWSLNSDIACRHFNGSTWTNSTVPTVKTTTNLKRRWRKRDWNTTPGWKLLRDSQGYLNTLYMSETQENYLNFPGWQVGKFRKGTSYQTLEPFQLAVPTAGNSYFYKSWYDPAKMDPMVKEAQIKALLKARDKRVDVAVLIGEGHQTTKMIAETAKTLGRAYRNFRRGRFKQAAKALNIPFDGALKKQANNWLAYQYGWKPLLSDVKGAAETLAQHVARPRKEMFSVSAQVEESENWDFPSWTSYTAGPSLSGFTCVTKGGVKKRTARAGLLLTFEYRASALAAQLGFGLADPLVVAWELTPFSFVFDWFIQVGDYLEAISALQGFKVLDGWTDELYDFRGQVAFTPLNGWVQETDLSTPTYNLRLYKRSRWTGQMPYFPTYTRFSSISVERIITTASLWLQRVVGDRQGYTGGNPFGKRTYFR